MAKQSTVGPYQLYVATYGLDPTQSQNTKFDVAVGSGSGAVADSFKNSGDLPNICTPLGSNSSNSTGS